MTKKKIEYEQGVRNKGSKKGTKPNPSKLPRVPGSGHNRPATGYDPITKTWHHNDG